jgi:hypothetical protein
MFNYRETKADEDSLMGLGTHPVKVNTSDSLEVDPLQIESEKRKRKRCTPCYRAAGNRCKAQGVTKVTTSCGKCNKPCCMSHLYLVCQKCHRAGGALPPLQTPLEQSIEKQQQQISDLQQQVEELQRQLS